MLTRDHTVLQFCLPQPRLFTSGISQPASQLQSITNVWLVLIFHPTEGRKISLPRLHTEVAHQRWSPIPLQAQCKVALLICQTLLPLCHTATHKHDRSSDKNHQLLVNDGFRLHTEDACLFQAYEQPPTCH